MATSTFKKISSAAAAVVLGFSAMSHAGTVPYSTSFETTPDAQGQTYTAAPLIGQNGWVAEDGEAANGVATVGAGTAATGTQSVQITTPGTGAGFYDVYNSTLADHPLSSTAAVPGTPISPTLSGGVVNVSFGMAKTFGTTGDGAGIDIFDGNDNIIASLFAVTNTTTGANDLEVYNDSSPSPTVVTGDAGVGRGDGGFNTYRISLDFNSDTFTVFVDGNLASETFSFDPTETTIGGIAFATDDVGGATTAYFDDLTVVPEPASISLIGLGGLLLLAKRPKRLA